MGLFHSHQSQPSDKELQLQAQLRQAAAPYEAVITAALQWVARWALPECQVERVDDVANGYQWQYPEIIDAHPGQHSGERAETRGIRPE